VSRADVDHHAAAHDTTPRTEVTGLEDRVQRASPRRGIAEADQRPLHAIAAALVAARHEAALVDPLASSRANARCSGGPSDRSRPNSRSMPVDQYVEPSGQRSQQPNPAIASA
jgi:hypothetical protein